jgi:hypothetical protein
LKGREDRPPLGGNSGPAIQSRKGCGARSYRESPPGFTDTFTGATGKTEELTVGFVDTVIPIATKTAKTDNKIQTVVINPAEIQNTPGGQEERKRAMKSLSIDIIKLNGSFDGWKGIETHTD